MSSSPTFIMNPTRGEEEEEEMLAIDQGRSHTPPPRSRPSSRIEILLMDLVRSQEESKQRLENLARSQAEQSRSTEGKLVNLARSQAEQSRSTEGKLENLARSQAEQSRSAEERLDGLAKGQADLAYAQIGHVAELANIMGRLSSVERSLHGTPSTSPNPGRRGSPSSAETMHVSVPSINGDLVPLSQAEVRRRGVCC